MAEKKPEQQVLFKKKMPKMPDGYYSGDKPNPNLRAFVEAHLRENPYDPETDDYDVPAFDRPIESTKATAIYNMHTYWSKKPHDAIRQYIRHYTNPGDLVLDPFCGSGGTALTALMEGRKAIAIDRSPAATFITKNYCTPVDVDELKKAFVELKRNTKPEIDWLYETQCDRCGGKAKTVYTIYSQVFQCPRCMGKVPLFDCVDAEGKTAKGKSKKIKACPRCYERGLVEEISTRLNREGYTPVAFGYECLEQSPCKPRRSERRSAANGSSISSDIEKLQQIELAEIPYGIPQEYMMHCEGDEPWGILWRPYHSGVNRADEFFTKRNLWAIVAIRDMVREIQYAEEVRDFLMCGVSAILFKSSRLMGYREDGIGRVMTGTYWLPPIQKDINVWSYYEEWFGDALRHVDEKNASLSSVDNISIAISTQSVTDLKNIPSISMDYIFTDPPYSWKVQYGECNFLWEVFLGLDTHWHDEEIIVNKVRGKSEADWARMMRQAMTECYRVLKPGRWVSLCYHDTSEGTWALIQDIMAETGFLVEKNESTLFIDADQKSIKQITADKINKRDLVINFRKPKPGEVATTFMLTGDEDESTFNEKVRGTVREYLTLHPGASKDRIYDEVVSRMVRAGRMEAHNFEELLRQVAEEVRQPVKKDLFSNEEPNLFGTHQTNRWYLKESQLSVQDEAESAKEDAAAEKVSSFMAQRLEDEPALQGVHYSDLFEYYIYAVKDKPRHSLAEWLPDYFYKTDEGAWRPPQTEEEEKLKAEGRAKGTNRRIKRYLAYLEQGVAVPEKERPNDATLAEWIRHCKRSGLYEQSKFLYENGGLNLDNLPEEVMVNVEEDYQVCVRSLARSTG